MGDIADMMLEGILCEGCGDFLTDKPRGYPDYCYDCKTKLYGDNYDDDDYEEEEEDDD